jgi:hypothetical protein
LTGELAMRCHGAIAACWCGVYVVYDALFLLNGFVAGVRIGGYYVL